jgi:hypothetical protein
MASFDAPHWYEIRIDTSQNYYINSSAVGTFYFLATSSDVPVFEVGQDIQANNSTTGNIQGKIMAFVPDGIVVQLTDGRYRLFSTTNTYEVDQALIRSTTPPVCFVKGTLIETMRGAVPIEVLVVDDRVFGSAGVRTVKWVGWRHYHAVSLRTLEQREMATPVRIVAGALGDNLPAHDLRISPWHHLYIDGVLVRAKDLINGQTIVQELDCQQFSYYHVELDQFDVIRAHGVYSESWADGGNRDFFQNVSVTCLRPEDRQRRHADRPGFKVLRKPEDIAVIYARITRRTEALMSIRQTRIV